MAPAKALEDELTLLVTEIRHTVEEFRKRFEEEAPVEIEGASGGFIEIAGPASDADVYRIEVRGPVDDLSELVLRKDGTPLKLTIERQPGILLRTEVPLKDMDAGTWEAVFVHNGTEHVITRTELE
jgi:hypothetical protein